jgi:hypothetical protein
MRFIFDIMTLLFSIIQPDRQDQMNAGMHFKMLCYEYKTFEGETVSGRR